MTLQSRKALRAKAEMERAKRALEPVAPGFEPNAVNSSSIRFPPRDLEDVNNYLSRMWEEIRKHFNGGDPQVAVEVGSRRGAWASGLMEHTVSTRLFCVDVWAGRSGYGDMLAWLARCEKWAFRRAFPLRGPSTMWVRAFPYMFDLVFIDAAHDYESARHDMEQWYERLSSGGLMICHDGDQEAVRNAFRDAFPGDSQEPVWLGMQRAESFLVRKP